jgi:enoyl-CoA hydratase/carnithine racemase
LAPDDRRARGTLDKIERQYVTEVLASNDGNEGIAAFIERRKPVWKDA